MKESYPIADTWLPFEVHPETPLSGVAIKDRFPGWDIDEAVVSFNKRCAPFRITFGHWTILSNSHLALAAGEFARDHGQHDAMHEGLFHACFTECRNIGDMGVILDVAHKIGFDSSALERALTHGDYESRLIEAAKETRDKNITAAPTFFIEDQPRIVGAVGIEIFKAALDKAMGKGLEILG